MSKVGESIIRGLEDALAYVKGDKTRGRVTIVMVPERVDAKTIRRKVGMSQAKFAATFGVNLRTLQDWEQGRANPEGPARALLTIIDREPKAVRRALAPRKSRRARAAA